MFSGKRHSVLIVDSNKSVLRVFRRLLEKDGFRVVTAETSKEAAQKLQGCNFDAALVDMELPDIECTDFLYQIQNKTTKMSEHIDGAHRKQTILFPDTLDEYVDEGNPVRFIDAFIDSLNIEKLGFKHSIPCDTGRPSYDPSDLLKLYVYGYLNQVRSSRKLERECHRNLEVMWLMKKLAPDFKTIADFRKNNVDCIKPVFKEFVYLCRSLDLYGAQIVAIDGTKFKAVNSKSNNLNEKTVALRLKRTEEKIAEYLKEMDQNDTTDSAEDKSIKVDELKEKICKLEEEKQRYEQIQGQMKATGQKEVSLVDPDSPFDAGRQSKA